MTIYPLFHNIVHSIEIKDFGKIQDELIDFVYNEENENPIGQIYSNRGGWQSNPFYHQSDNILFSLLYKHVGDYFSDTDFFRENLKFEYSDLTAALIEQGFTITKNNEVSTALDETSKMMTDTFAGLGEIEVFTEEDVIATKDDAPADSN